MFCIDFNGALGDSPRVSLDGETESVFVDDVVHPRHCN